MITEHPYQNQSVWITTVGFACIRHDGLYAVPRNARLLPARQPLIRAVFPPPSQQQTELLRAAQYGNETPPEQLLRAGEKSREDV